MRLRLVDVALVNDLLMVALLTALAGLTERPSVGPDPERLLRMGSFSAHALVELIAADQVNTFFFALFFDVGDGIVVHALVMENVVCIVGAGELVQLGLD